jgi:hypothetical protein
MRALGYAFAGVLQSDHCGGRELKAVVPIVELEVEVQNACGYLFSMS